MFDWQTKDGEDIVAFTNKLRSEGMRNWGKIAQRVNDNFDINFSPDMVRKGWRNYGDNDEARARMENKPEESSASFKVEYNVGEATSSGKTIKTLEDLIVACEINLDVWKIDRHVINKWEVKSKIAPVHPLFQVKAWLSKRVAEDTKFPVIQPVKINMPRISTATVARKGGLMKALIIPDSQIGFRKNLHDNTLEPFHDRKALDLAVQIAEYIKPQRVVLLGDMLDLPDWSDKFLRSPDMYWTTQPSLIELAWWIGRLRKAVPDVRIDYIEGNHEQRLKKMMINHLVAAYDLKPVGDMKSPPAMSIPALLRLEDLNVAYWGNYPKDEVWITNKLRCRHGATAKKGGGNTSRNILKDTFVSEIYGHSHRFEHSCKTVKTARGMETFHAFSPGTISKIDGSVPSNTSEEDWQQGLGVVYYDEYDFNINSISINNGKCIFDDGVFIGEERVEQLNKDTGWSF